MDICLDERAYKVVGKILHYSFKNISDNDIENLQLDRETYKPYYVFCYWEDDYNGSFCDAVDLKDLFKDRATREYDESYNIKVYDVETLQLLQLDVQFNVKITIDGKEI